VTHFLKQALARGVTVRPATAAHRLVFDGKRVTGVVTQDGTTVRRPEGRGDRVRLRVDP
jgi:glycine/D-amino acid oxidase-like deaminating enzyme